MKRHLITLFLAMAAATVFAQYPLGTGQYQVNGGTGLSSWGFPFYGGFDYGFNEDISIGAELSYRQYQKKKDELYLIKGFSVNGNYHFSEILDLPKNIDVYGGLNIGFFQSNSGIFSFNRWNTGAQVGARYYFKNNLAFNLEAGSGNAFSGGKLGLTYIFK